jgi:hypothetical protein
MKNHYEAIISKSTVHYYQNGVEVITVRRINEKIAIDVDFNCGLTELQIFSAIHYMVGDLDYDCDDFYECDDKTGSSYNDLCAENYMKYGVKLLHYNEGNDLYIDLDGSDL